MPPVSLEASPLWQTIFLGWVFLSLAWSIWCGWRAGVIRAAISLFGLGVAVLVARQIAALSPGGFGDFGGAPPGSVGLVIAVACGIGIFVAIQVVSAMLFKRTAHHGSWFARFIWGIGGAALGAAFGVVVVLGILALIRGTGTFLEPRFAETPDIKAGLSRLVVKLKNSVEAGSTGDLFAKIDPIPETTYTVVGKLGSVLANPTARARFFDVPDVAKLLQDPRFVAISSDPDASDAVMERRVGDFVTNAHVLAAASDPAFLARLKRIDLEAALDYALDESGGAQQQPAQP